MARTHVVAYRVSQEEGRETAEGFDDDGEEGAGEKLLHLLQKMEIENVLLVVCVWDQGVRIGEAPIKGGEFFKIITDRARELLNQIQQRFIDDESNTKL